MKCSTPEEFAKTQGFYGETLGLPKVRQWDAGVMFDLGGVLLEIFSNGTESLTKGVWQHIALAVSEAGYEITMEPRDIVIACEPRVPARIAFCVGPMGEEIEFFHEK